MRWRQLQEGEIWKSFDMWSTGSWRLSGRAENIGNGTLGYAMKLRLKNHRHCNCFRSKPIIFVAEHHPATGDFPMFYTALNYSARQFLLNNPTFEPYEIDRFLAHNTDMELLEDPVVFSGCIELVA